MDTGEQLVEQDAEREDVGPGVRLGPEQLLGRHWPFVLAEAQRHGVSIAKPDIVDPLVIDRAVDRYRRGSRRLDAVAAHYGHDPAQAHDARTDAIARALGAQYIQKSEISRHERYSRVRPVACRARRLPLPPSGEADRLWMAAAEKRPRKLIAGGWAAWMSRPVVPGVSGHSGPSARAWSSISS